MLTLNHVKRKLAAVVTQNHPVMSVMHSPTFNKVVENAL